MCAENRPQSIPEVSRMPLFEKMKIFITIIILFALLLSTISPLATAGNFIEELGGAIAKIYGLMTKHRIVLYTACATYYVKFNRWPSSKAELESYFKNAEGKNAEKNTAILEVLNELNLDFTQMEDGNVLIEGGYEEKNEKAFEKARLGKCRLSVIGRRTEDGFVFSPSEKAKGNRDYFNLPMNLNEKKKAR